MQLGAAQLPTLPSALCVNLTLLGCRTPDCSPTRVIPLSQGHLNSHAEIEVFHPRFPREDPWQLEDVQGKLRVGTWKQWAPPRTGGPWRCQLPLLQETVFQMGKSLAHIYIHSFIH